MSGFHSALGWEGGWEGGYRSDEWRSDEVLKIGTALLVMRLPSVLVYPWTAEGFELKNVGGTTLDDIAR